MSESPWISNLNGFPVVDWEAARLEIRASRGANEQSASAAWKELTLDWMQAFCRLLGPAATITRSPTFILAGTLSGREHATILKFLESRLAQIVKVLGNAPLMQYPGGIPVVIFSRRRHYELYEHLDALCDPGDQDAEAEDVARSGAVFVNRGYGHIIVPPDGLEYTWQNLLAHELGHAVVSHFDLPVWLDEGVATSVEGGAEGVEESPAVFWRLHGLDAFWEGDGFCHPELSAQCYALAFSLFSEIRKCICNDHNRLLLFLRDAERHDLGSAAARQRIGLSLGQIAERILGPGDWEPPEWT